MTAPGASPDDGTALADTSLFIALEQRRSLAGTPPRRLAVSVVTVAELHLGVLAATDPAVRARRLDTVTRVEALEPLEVDRSVAVAWAALRVSLRDAGARMPVNDSWIAATALARGMPVMTQDADFDDVPGLAVIRV